MFDYKKWREEHKEELNRKQREWYQKNKEKVRIDRKNYNQRPEVKEYKKQYQKEYNQRLEVRLRTTQYNKEYGEVYRLANKKRISKQMQTYNLGIKREVLSHYAPELKCVRCGFSDIRALSIDHINGGGTKHTKEIKKSLYYWLKEKGYPQGYQVLCMNCQFIKKAENREDTHKGERL